MDSGNASADDDDEESDYENQLYSLVHYSEDTSKVGDVISNSDTLVYVSKGTKVSRLNPVRSIIDKADRSSPFGNNKYGQTNQNQFQTSEDNLRNLIYAYKNAASDFSSSTPIRINCHQNISLVNAFKQNSDPNILRTETSENSYIEIGNQSVSDCINVMPLNESVSCDTKSYDCSSTRKNNYTGSKSKKINCDNYSEHGGGSSKRHLTYDGKVDKNDCIENGHILSKSNSQISRRKKNKSHVSVIEVDEELASSKYNMELNRGEKSTPLRKSDNVTSKNATHVKDSMKHSLNESVIVIDDSDSNSSILEMEAPVKEPPPVVVIVTSEDDEDKAVCKTEIEEDDIIVLYSGGEKSSAENSNENRQLNEDGHVQKKSKKKKKKKEKKGRKLASFSSQEISPSSWTENMLHFYNDSWGGENFDVKKLQLSMSGKRSKWPVLVTDLDSRMNHQHGIKCQKCNQFGHRARFCSEVQKPVVCLYCGLVGHVQTRCPTAICLRCGKSSLVYNSGCHMCSSNRNDNQPCSMCKLIGHHATDCPETWRRYHSTTTEEDLSSEKKTLYKPCNQQHCSNCAERGHQYHECDKSKQQGNLQKRANSSFWGEQRKHAKRRKLEKKNAQNMLHLNNGCPLFPYFVPIYNRYR